MANNPEPSARVIDVLAEMLECPPGEREAYLAEACGSDASLHAEVRSLADQHGAAREFLETPAVASANTEALDPAQGKLEAGSVVGDCKILRLIGEGGMGEVYLAEDTKLGRQVAVKLLKRHLHDALGQRFQHERRVLAGLTHPGIARLYSAAVTDGHAYLVMEYVEGERLDEYCDQRRPGIGERLALFRKVCAAVAYAHQNLVIHRDLKPANIRVTLDGEPKLLDFGIAKLVDPRADHDPAQTVTLFSALTPGYASPEQLRGEAVTTATDIFSLGVVLYELLCGRRPFDPRIRRTGDPHRADREESVSRPSGGVPAADAAESRATSPARLIRQLAGDLDNIVLTAMRFEAARRYPSVSQFSEDIRRHLDGQPVSARKETLRYVGAKFVSRNKALTVAAALALLALVGGIVATAWQARLANEQRRRADRRFDDVRRLADSVMGEINDSVQLLAGSTATQKLIVARALEYLDNLSKEADTPGLGLDLAAAYEKIGNVQGNPYGANLGDTAGAVTSYRKAESLLRSLPDADSTTTRERRLALGRIYRALGDLDDTAGNFAERVAFYRQSLDVFAQFAREQPSDPVALDELARAYDVLGDGLSRTENGETEQVRCFTQGLTYRQKLVAQVPSNVKYRRGLAVAQVKLGQLTLQDPGHGIGEISRGVQGLQSLSEASPDNVRLRRDYATCLQMLGQSQADTGDHAGALSSRQKGLAIRRQIAAADPNDDRARSDLATALNDVSDSLTSMGQPEESLVFAGQSLALSETMMAAEPGNASSIRLCGLLHKRIGNAHAALAARESSAVPVRLVEWDDAQAAYEKSRALFSDLKAKGVVRAEDSDMLDKLAANIAGCLRARGELGK